MLVAVRWHLLAHAQIDTGLVWRSPPHVQRGIYVQRCPTLSNAAQRFFLISLLVATSHALVYSENKSTSGEMPWTFTPFNVRRASNNKTVLVEKTILKGTSLCRCLQSKKHKNGFRAAGIVELLTAERVYVCSTFQFALSKV